MSLTTKVIALDVYGTILHSRDYENKVPPRRGFLDFISQAKQKRIPVITYSDSDLKNLKIDLRESRVPLDLFFDFYYMETEGSTCPKDPDIVLRNFHIRPNELFVIGNDDYLDLSLARTKGCQTLVPTYDILPDTFDFGTIEIK
jgi:FMN phosphatase YigB (HAD superfamily)